MMELGVTDFDRTVGLQVVTNQSGATYDSKGNAVRQESQPVDIDGDVQPVTGKTLQDMPEGLIKSAEFAVWTSYDLKTDHVVIYNGEQYRVMKVWSRRHDGFTKAVMGRLKNDQ